MRTALAIFFVLAAATTAAAQVETTAPAAPSAPVAASPPPAPVPAPVDATHVTNTASAPVASAPTSSETTSADAERAQRAQQFYDSLTRQTGVINIANNKVALNIPATHYFVGPEDARRIIVDVWGNPPTSAEGVNGMIFPQGANPATGAWGAIVQYVAEGYVPDDEARTTNYTDLLHQMQESTTQENTWRSEHNYPTMQLVGWAEPPHYDAREHKLYWAKEIIFDHSEGVRTLNYDIRVLGREGHLVVSFVATMEELALIRQNAPAIMAMPTFTSGNTYADYREGVDQRASYGIVGLIAGGTLAAVAQKTGLLAIILAFGKKFIVLIIAGFAALGGAIRKMFGGKQE